MRIIIVFILLIYFKVSVSQEVFDLLIKSTKDEELNDALELPNGDLILCGGIGKTNFPSMESGFIIKISSTGEILLEKYIELPDTSVEIQEILQINDNLIVISKAGNKQFAHANTIYYQEFDSGFKLLKEKRYTVSVEPVDVSFIKTFVNFNGNIILYGAIIKYSDKLFYYEMFFFEISAEGDSIRSNFVILEGHNYNAAWSIIEKRDSSGYYCLVEDYPYENYFAWGQVLSINNELEILSYKNIPDLIGSQGDIKWFTDTTYILTGIKVPMNEPFELGVIILDTAHNVINYNRFGEDNIRDIPALYKSIEYCEGDEFVYLAGTSNMILSSFPNEPSYIMFIKTNRELEAVWEKFYKGDAYYSVRFFKRTLDGGFIFLTNRYDYLTQNDERDIYIYKVDSAGNIPVSAEKGHEITVSELIVFPNPGNNELKIRTAIQSIGGEFCLYEISGKLILKQKITGTNTTINTSALLTGTYIYKYYYKNEMIETGKWIKDSN